MISVSQSAIALMVILATSAAALPCDPPMYDRREAADVDAQVAIKADCSFADADAYIFGDYLYEGREYFLLRKLFGAPARDIGNGRVAQRLSEPECGGVTEHLLFVDCTTGDTVMVEGVEEPGLDIDGYYVPSLLIRYIQPPYGDAGVTSATTVEDLTKRATRAGYSIVTDVNGFLDEPYNHLEEPIKYRKKNDRYDVGCGCKLFYPDSTGALN